MVVDSVELQLYAVLGIIPLLHIQSSWFLTLRELHKWRFGIEQRGTGLNELVSNAYLGLRRAPAENRKKHQIAKGDGL